MAFICSTRLAGAGAATLILAAASIAAGVSGGSIVHASAPAHVVIAFGRQGGNIRPLTVTIDNAGAVKMSYPVDGTPASLRVSKDTLDGLLKLATAEGFLTMPTRIIGHGLPDIGGRYITIHTTAAAKTVSVRYVRNAAFDQLYAVLSAVAGLLA